MTALISTSLNVVSMAALFWASFRREAMTRRRRVIGTRSSRISSTRGAGFAACGADGAEAAGAEAVPVSIAFSTSPLVMRPSLPVAGIAAGLRLFSSTRRLTAGDSGRDALAAADGAGADAAGASAGETGAGETGAGVALTSSFLASCFAAGAGLAAAVAFSSRTAITAFGITVSPSPTAWPVITPADGAGTSSVTLSVSSSATASSAATLSPTFLSHRETVASATDSPRGGTMISMAMTFSYSAALLLA